ncbi:insulinase family protein [Carboxylicivirga mesophila]|uniref:Insulinase family protein n=1 Tax=Carboxylicivirga mesophila TaxID=1166478 RepID=A0ABS5KEU1_9BACT|nr:pitrilysin family protein [Carboxylicivirga mesophila]MBS2212963.1 insulinase family protein [Carboxylicivirga mesophila]
MEYQIYTLRNGIRVIHRQDKSAVGYCGLIINAGSRDEKEEEHGMAHFIEHVIFKGTKKRKAYHVLSRLDDVGGELNAYTTKEETCIYASFLKQDYERAIELIHDITFNSTFPTKELAKEKEVIVDEINSYKDSPAEYIFDEFEEMLFKGDPMGRNILGTEKKLKTFDENMIRQFMQANYNTDEMVFCSVGNASFKKIVKWAEKYFGDVEENIRSFSRPEVNKYVPESQTIERDTHQCHVMIGNVAYDFRHDKRLHLHLLNNLLGGPGMNSRLNMALREKNGIAYNVESSYAPYFGTGVFNIYFGTDEENLIRSFSIIDRELKLLRDRQLGALQLHKAARQLKGQLTISSDNRENLMLSMGKSFMLYDQVDPLDVICNKIDSIKASELQDVANEMLNPNSLSYLIYK